MTRESNEIEDTDDPIARIRRIRDASAKRFATTRELADYLSKKWLPKTKARKPVATATHGRSEARNRRKAVTVQ